MPFSLIDLRAIAPSGRNNGQAPKFMYQMINWPFVFEGVLLVTHSFVLYLFPFTFLISTYWFVFFKLQVSELGAVCKWWPWYLFARRVFMSFLRPLRVDTNIFKKKTSSTWERCKVLAVSIMYSVVFQMRQWCNIPPTYSNLSTLSFSS